MHFVYLLKTGNENKQYYIGMSGDIARRLEEHLRGNVYTTRRLTNPALIYYEAYTDRVLAIDRENQLKRFGSAYTALLKRLKLK